MVRGAQALRTLLLLVTIAAVLSFPQFSPSQVTVTGRVVVGETGRSLERATVALEPEPGTGGEARQAHSDANGRFRWDNVPAGQYVVRVQTEAYLERTREVTVGEEDVHLALSVLTTPDLGGRAIRPDGEPLARSELVIQGYVQAISGTRSTGVSPTVRTDEQGRFQFRVRQYGRWQVTALAPGIGYAVVSPFNVRKGEDPVELAIQLKPVGTVSGRVVVKGTDEPVADARVFCHPRDDTPNLHFSDPSPAAGADGRFTVLDLAPGKYWLSAFVEGYQADMQEVDLAEGEHVRNAVVEVAPGILVHGRVFAPDGRTPVANADVQPTNAERTQTDAEGRFIVENLRPGSCRLTVVAEGFAPLEHRFEVAEREEPPELKLVIAGRGGTITGRVVDGDADQPVAGAVVVALEPEEHSPTGVPHEVEHYHLELLSAMGVPRGSPMRTETEADGTYTLDHIPAGTYVVAVIREQGLNLWQTGVPVREGEMTADVNFEVRQKMPGALNVRVLLPDGRPLANASVRTAVEHPNGSGGRNTNTDADAYFQVRLGNPGVYAVQVTLDGYMPAVGQLQVDDVKGSPELTVTLEPVPPGGPPVGSISGRVFMPDGTTPAKGICVAPFTKNAFFLGADAEYGGGGGTYRMSTRLAVQTGEDGVFVVESLPPGTYGVIASPRRLGGRPLPAPPERADVLPTMSDLVEVTHGQVTGDVRLVLGEGGSIAVTVTDAETGEPVENAHVSCNATGQEGQIPFHNLSPHAETGETGRGRVTGLAPGTCSVIVFAEGYKPVQKRDVVVEAGKETAIEVKLEPVGE